MALLELWPAQPKPTSGVFLEPQRSLQLRFSVRACFQGSRASETKHPSSLHCGFLSPIFSTMEDQKSKRKPKKRPRLASQQQEEQQEMGDIEDLFSEAETQTIRASLLEWYDKNKRDLPWRRTARRRRDALNIENDDNSDDGGEEDKERRAYEVWVSEVMLQQTRVQAVIDYYNRWMQRWPTLHYLAQASLEEVNEMWAGLGYYRRARFLLEGAKMIVEREDGFPSTASALRKIKGIGDYTAGAIASIAFEEVVPLVDGNVIRVLARLKAVSANSKDRLTIKNFWKLAAQLVDPSRPGDFNQSLMELGATICTPLNPSCSSCPISDQCRARSISKQDRSVLVTDFPTKGVKAKQRHDLSFVCVVEILGNLDISERSQSDSRFLLIKRPDEGLLAGLWEFPSVVVDEETDLTMRRQVIDQYLKKSFRLDPKKTYSIILREDVGEFVHVFTHIRRKIYVELLVVHLKGSKDLFNKLQKETISVKFVDSNGLSTMGLTSAVRKVYSMIEKFKQDGLPPNSNHTRKRINSKNLKHS